MLNMYMRLDFRYRVNQARSSNTYEKLPSLFIDDVILQVKRSFLFSNFLSQRALLLIQFSLLYFSPSDLFSTRSRDHETIASRIFIITRMLARVYFQFFGVTTCVSLDSHARSDSRSSLAYVMSILREITFRLTSRLPISS